MSNAGSEKNGGFRRRLSAPVMINLELTAGCNLKCRYCYNHWREDGTGNGKRISPDRMKHLVAMIAREGVFHVVLTGGEPLLNFDVLEYALAALHDAGITTSVNSNLTLADPGKIQRLRETGLDHVLTSLNSYDAAMCDAVAARKGTHEKTLRGIRNAVEGGLRVSVNMIVSDKNRDHVYRTAELCARLGAQRLFGTRLVPSVNVEDPSRWEFSLGRSAALQTLDELIRARDELGIAVGSLISYPLCFLEDLERYADFVGRGCPAQRGNRMVVDADGEAHACTHESRSYGNVFDLGIAGAFQRMRPWHDGSLLNEACDGCAYIGICRSGCRSAAFAHGRTLDGKDPLMSGPEKIRAPYRVSLNEEIFAGADPRLPFVVSDTLRFRREDGFFVVNIRWANAVNMRNDMAEFLQQRKLDGRPFTLGDFLEQGSERELIHLLAKEIVFPRDREMRRKMESRVKAGCSLDPEDLDPSLRGYGQ